MSTVSSEILSMFQAPTPAPPQKKMKNGEKAKEYTTFLYIRISNIV